LRIIFSGKKEFILKAHNINKLFYQNNNKNNKKYFYSPVKNPNAKAAAD